MQLIQIFALSLLKSVPVERVAAWLLTAILSRAPEATVKKYAKTAAHLGELGALLSRVAEDGKFEEAEINLLKRWAAGLPAKDLEKQVAALDGGAE